jgi:hypothetical protein
MRSGSIRSMVVTKPSVGDDLFLIIEKPAELSPGRL